MSPQLNPLKDYRLSRGRAAIVTEIYLPQKYALSPQVVQALRDSMDGQAVREHFRHTPADHVKSVLPQLLQLKYDAIRDRLMDQARERTLEGYSIASIVGGFKGPPLAYDANAVIQILDWPIPDAESSPLVRDDAFFQRVVRTVFGLRRHNETRPSLQALSVAVHNQAELLQDKPLGPDEERAAALVYEWLENWMDEETVLLYGFVVYRLAVATEGSESVIMLTSHFEVVHELRNTKPKRGISPVTQELAEPTSGLIRRSDNDSA